MTMRTMSVLASLAVAASLSLAGTEESRVSGEASGEAGGSRLQEVVLSPSRMPTIARNLWGEDVPSREGNDLRGCQQTSTYLANAFNDTQWTAQAGFAEQEIFAASYTLNASDFPIRIDTIQSLFVTSQTTVTTTTRYTVFVWEGTPQSGTVVAQFSSDDVILPNLVMPPGNNGTLLEIAVDPNDPEQIVVQDNGSRTFSIGFRIDEHNNQTQNPCLVAPPSSSNAFPATDTNGLSNPTNNWLFAVNCGLFGCPAGWNRFSQLGLCTPSGDWALSATWTSLLCTPGVGACCLPDGSCVIDSQGNCAANGGTFQGDGSVCENVTCDIPPQACCFETTGGCLNLDPQDCENAGGVPGGVGTTCATTVCFPEGACCLPDGSCADGLTPDECAALNGTFEGDGTTCASVVCPEPTGACCFANGFCLELIEGDCVNAGGSWGGPGTDCFDGNGNGSADICEAGGCTDADIAEPFGVLDLGDITAFITGFNTQDPIADFAPPAGVFDLADITAFVTSFIDGCP
jgi:hypothetical protein